MVTNNVSLIVYSNGFLSVSVGRSATRVVQTLNAFTAWMERMESWVEWSVDCKFHMLRNGCCFCNENYWHKWFVVVAHVCITRTPSTGVRERRTHAAQTMLQNVCAVWLLALHSVRRASIPFYNYVVCIRMESAKREAKSKRIDADWTRIEHSENSGTQQKHKRIYRLLLQTIWRYDGLPFETACQTEMEGQTEEPKNSKTQQQNCVKWE